MNWPHSGGESRSVFASRRPGEEGSARIESVCLEVPESERPALLHELLAVEIESRLAAGEQPTPEEYSARFSKLASSIPRLFEEVEPPRSPAWPRGIDPPKAGTRPKPDPAYNLLFGLLRIQNNFIDRDALLAAFNSWVADKARDRATPCRTRRPRPQSPCHPRSLGSGASEAAWRYRPQKPGSASAPSGRCGRTSSSSPIRNSPPAWRMSRRHVCIPTRTPPRAGMLHRRCEEIGSGPFIRSKLQG